VSELELQAYLHWRIPLAAAMGVRVRSVSPARVELQAPLAPNINNDEMAFGGSIVAVAMLAAWTLLFVREQGAGSNARLVIQHGSMSYERPITDDFAAISELADEARYRRFRLTLARHGRARIALGTVLEQDGLRVGAFEGAFVAVSERSAQLR